MTESCRWRHYDANGRIVFCGRPIGDAPATTCWRHMYESERSCLQKFARECAADRTGLLARVADLRDSLAAIVRCLEEEARDGDGIREGHVEAHVAAKSAIARADNAADNARDEVQRLITKASEVPGMSATIEELRYAVTNALRECERCDHEAARRILREALP